MTTQFCVTGLDECIQSAMADAGIPGMAVGLLRDGQRETAGFGIANVETGFPVLPESVFQIGSISKIFTTTLIMRLVGEGNVELDVPITTYLPDFKLADAEALRRLTLRHLLTHTAGFEGDRFDDYGNGDEALARSVADYDTLAQHLPVGQAMSYCNTGFNVAGRVIAVVTGKPFERAMREFVFAPCGLRKATYFADEAITYAASVGHEYGSEGGTPMVARPYPLAHCVNPAGGIIADVSDLLRFAEVHLGRATDGEGLPRPDLLHSMREPQVAVGRDFEWGIGWQINRYGGETVVGHGGTTNGFQARLSLVPSQGLALAILTNSERGSRAIHEIERFVLREVAGLDVSYPPLQAMPAESLAVFAGRYVTTLSDATFTVVGNQLEMTNVTTNAFTGAKRAQPPVLLSPIGEREFMVFEGPSKSTRVQFVGEPNAAPTHARVGLRLAARHSP